MVKKVYAVVYDDGDYFDEWFNTFNEALHTASFSGGTIYIALIPNDSWDFYDIGEKIQKVARCHSPYKWRIEKYKRRILLKEDENV